MEGKWALGAQEEIPARGIGIVFSQQRLCTKPETAHSLSYHNIKLGESNPRSATSADPNQVILSHLGNRWPRPTCPDLPRSGPPHHMHILATQLWEARPAKRNKKKKQALGDCVFFCLPPACQEVFLVGMEMVATVLLISEERERDAHHCTFPSSSCAAPSSVEGVSCALRLLYRNAAFLRPMKIDPGYDIARPKRRTRLHISTSPPPLASLGGRIRQRPRKRITSLNDKVTTSIP